MEKVLAPVLWKTCVVYIDDLVIFSQTKEEHLEHLAEVHKLLDEAGLRMKVEKCHFGVRRMQLLGFDFREDGMRPQEERALRIQQVEVEKPELLGDWALLSALCTPFSRPIATPHLPAEKGENHYRMGPRPGWGH